MKIQLNKRSQKITGNDTDTIYSILLSNANVGVVVLNTNKVDNFRNFAISKINIKNDFRRKGIAKAVYIKLNEIAKKSGFNLKSDLENNITKEAKELWFNLVRNRLATVGEDEFTGELKFKML